MQNFVDQARIHPAIKFEVGLFVVLDPVKGYCL